MHVGTLLGEVLKAHREGRPLMLVPPKDLSSLLKPRRELGSHTNITFEAKAAGVDPETGPALWTQRVHNKIPLTGRNVVARLLANNGPAPGFIALGTGSTPPEDNDVALEAEVFRAAVTRRQLSTSSILYKLFVDDTEANGFTISELGIFAGTAYGVENLPLLGGDLFSRATVTPTIKDSSIQLVITCQYNIASE